MTLLKAIQGAVFYQGAVEGFRSSVDSIRHCSLNTEVNTLPRWPTRLTSERATGRGTTINPGASENQLDTDLTVNELWDILPGMCLQVYCGPNESAGQLHKWITWSPNGCWGDGLWHVWDATGSFSIMKMSELTSSTCKLYLHFESKMSFKFTLSFNSPTWSFIFMYVGDASKQNNLH